MERAASSASPVLITGETGTGKTLVAKVIHYKSPAGKAPFISINCTALPENLIEAELFGYEKGAFTSAVTKRTGASSRWPRAGSFFLDEIGEMPLHLRAKPFSVIEDKQVRRLGGESVRPVNVRIMAATGVDLERSLGKTFRKDLYYRLSVIRMHIPPLRERLSDIPLLCSHLMTTIACGHEVPLSEAETASLCLYDWPGNVRELKNILERAYLLQKGREFRPAELLGKTQQQTAFTESGGDAPLLSMEELEMRHIRHALGRMSGNYAQAARAIGISLSTLKRKLKRYD